MLPPTKAKVLIVLSARDGDSVQILRGLSDFQREVIPWSTFVDENGKCQNDPKWLRSTKWDGVICRQNSPALIRACAEINLPLVDLEDSPCNSDLPKIRPNNINIGELAADHFIERGFQHFVFYGFSDRSWSQERRNGFQSGLQEGGHAPILVEVNHPKEQSPDWDEEQQTLLAKMMERVPTPMAILAASDQMAVQVLKAVQSFGYQVPDDVSILGVDNEIARCETVTPSLSSVEKNGVQIGYLAGEMLEYLMSGHLKPRNDIRVDPIGIVERQSTAKIVVNDPRIASALQLIRESACHGISIDDVARKVSSSRGRLERGFRTLLGHSPQHEIRRMQVARIRELLLQTDYPLKIIADLTGFQHVEYMTVVFKRFCGQPPGAFRQRANSEFSIENTSDNATVCCR